MPLLITDSEADTAMDAHARRGAVPSRKTPLATALIKAAVAAADAEGVNVGVIVQELLRRSARNAKPDAA